MDTEREDTLEKRPYDSGGRDGKNIVISQGTLKTATATRRKDLPYGPGREHGPAHTLILDLYPPGP